MYPELSKTLARNDNEEIKTMATFLELVLAVEDNNEHNGGKWSDWDSVSHIEDVYGELKVDGEDRHGDSTLEKAAMLEDAIKTNGKSLAEDLLTYERIIWGQNFHGSDCDKIAKKYA